MMLNVNDSCDGTFNARESNVESHFVLTSSISIPKENCMILPKQGYTPIVLFGTHYTFAEIFEIFIVRL